MRNLITILIVSILIAGLIGCEKYVSGFESDPLSPVDANALKTFVGAELSYVVFIEGFPAYLSAIWAQQINGADRQFTSYEAYAVTSEDFNNDWSTAYTGALSNLRVVQDKTAATGQRNLKGAAEILEGALMGTVTAVWGDVPYSEACQPPNYTPKYDPQLTVYSEVLQTLDQGIADLNANLVPLAQDALSLGGSAAKWVNFAHSLKARYLMHTARSQGYSATVLNQVITEANLGILSVTGSDDAMMTHGTVQNGNQNLWYDFMVSSRTGYMDAAVTFAIPMLQARRFDGKTDEAGRLAFYFNGTNLNTSSTGAYAINASYPAFRASETHLLLAEANARLGNTATAISELNFARTYNNNVFHNNSQAFVAGDFPTSADLLQAIFNEEYLSLMHQIEAWNFLRRVDYAVAYRDSAGTTHAFTTTHGTEFPQRFVYSSTEAASNPNQPAEPANAQFTRTAANQ
jgi:hypothetical protein